MEATKRTKHGKKKPVTIQIYASQLKIQKVEDNFKVKWIPYMYLERIIEYTNGIYLEFHEKKQHFYEINNVDDLKKILFLIEKKMKENLNLNLKKDVRKEEYKDFPFFKLNKLQEYHLEIVLTRKENRRLMLTLNGILEVDKNDKILNFHAYEGMMNIFKKKSNILVIQYYKDRNYEYELEDEGVLNDLLTSILEIGERKKIFISFTFQFELKKSFIILNFNVNVVNELIKMIQESNDGKEKMKYTLYFIHQFYIHGGNLPSIKDRKWIHSLLKTQEEEETLFLSLIHLIRNRESMEELLSLKMDKILKSWMLGEKNEMIQFHSCQLLRNSMEQMFDQQSNDKLEYQMKCFYFQGNHLQWIFQDLKKRDVKTDTLYLYSLFNVLQLLSESPSTDISIKKDLFELIQENIEFLFNIQRETNSLGIATNVQMLIKRTISYFSNTQKIQQISLDECFFISQIYKLFITQDEFLFSEISETIGYFLLKNERIQKLFKKMFPFPLFKLFLKDQSIMLTNTPIGSQSKKERFFKVKKNYYQNTLNFKKLSKNWVSFFKNSIESNVTQSNLIWNASTKNELKFIIYKEIQEFKAQVRF
jgi:hypothetical protein